MYREFLLGCATLAMLVLPSSEALAQSGSLTSDSPCQLAPGQTTCNVTLSWQTTGSPVSCLWLDTGGLFACTGNPSDSAVWPWTTAQSETMILRAHSSWNSISPSDPELARTTVVATLPNVAPSVSLTAPAAQGFAGYVSQSLALAATATDPDGSVARVDYFANGSLIARGYAPSFSATWAPSQSGEYALSARAFDDRGASADSPSRVVIVAEQGVPSIPATYGQADQFFPMFVTTPKRLTFRGVNDASLLYSWSVPLDATTWDFHWPNSTSPTLDPQNTLWERWQLRTGCAAGSEWLYVNSYHGRGEVTHDSTISTTRALLDYGGKIYDVTSVCGGIGQPYIPRNVSGQPMRIRVWGLIAGARQWFWEARFGYLGAATNTCWTGAGSQTRPVVTMSEGWWDDYGGWMSGGTGAMGSDGRPTGLDVTMVRSGRIARLAGYAWSITDGNWSACSVDFADYAL